MCIDPFVTLSSDGKTMMKNGTQGFSHAASAVYATISQEEKEELQKRCTEPDCQGHQTKWKKYF